MESVEVNNPRTSAPAVRDGGVFKLQINALNDEIARKISGEFSDQPVHLSRLHMLGINPEVISKGTVLFSEVEHSGDNRPSGEHLQSLNIGKNIEDYFISCDNKNFIADADGLFIISDKMPKIIPVSTDANVTVCVSDDSMSVFVDFYPAKEGGADISVQDVIEKIIDQNVVAELDEKLIEQKILEVKEAKEPRLKVEVAKGTKPVQGKDEYIEYLINVDPDSKPMVKEDGSIDFHTINSVVSVEQHQKIAILHALQKGVDGSDVRGKVLKAADGKKISFVLGPNLYRDKENREIIYASEDGFLAHTENSLDVLDTHVVKGDIDFSTGNITCKGSLKVFGNVNYGFELILSKNIDIMGSVSNAKLEAGENILIKGGFTGSNEGYIKAGGDVSIKYMQNQSVWCRSELTFQREILECNTYVKNKIVGQGLHASIIGGYAIAKDYVEVAYLGNEYGAPTHIELGYDYDVKQVIHKKLAELEKDKKEAEKLNNLILKFSSMKRLNEKQYDELKKIATTYKSIVQTMDTLKNEIRELNKQIVTPSKASIKVFKTIYPGVRITINGRHLNVMAPINSKTFMLSEDKEVIAV